MRLTITRKLALAFGALHVLMAGVAIVAVLAYATAGAGFRAVREAALNQEAAGNLRFALAGLLAAVNDFIITDKDEYRRDYEAARVEVERRLRELEALPLGARERRRMEAIAANVAGVNDTARAILAIEDPRVNARAAALMERMDYVHGDAVYAEVTRLFDSVAESARRAAGSLDERRRRSLTIVLLSAAGALLLSGAVVALATRHIAGPLRALARSADRIADRDFSGRLEGGTDDEIGALVRAFNAMADEIERRYAELESFAYSAAHDLKTPLAAIRGMASILASDFAKRLDGQGNEFVRSIAASSDRMWRLIDDLLEFARAGKVEFSREPVSLREMFEDIRADLDFWLRERNALLAVQPDLPAVVCDPIRLSQVWRNLISNAIKYNDKARPVVEVGCTTEGGGFCLFVRDNGIGIAEVDHERLFMPFQRGVHDERYEGTGIGLAIVKRVVENHGGRVRLESSPGEGTTAYVTIPGRVGAAAASRDGAARA